MGQSILRGEESREEELVDVFCRRVGSSQLVLQGGCKEVRYPSSSESDPSRSFIAGLSGFRPL